MRKKFYITTPIYYVNDAPHIGHACTTLFADIIARYYRLIGVKVFFLTGTDEHGLNITQAAEKAGLAPKKFCDQIAPRFKKVWRKLKISNDFFIRTTDPRHEKIVIELLKKIYKKGDIYKGIYQGLYCVGCEKFLTESDLENNRCPLHKPEQTIEQKEENWFFRLSKYVPRIIKLVEDEQANYIFPQGKRGEILSKLKAGVHDISISRTSVPWGIPIPWDKNQTIYVWIDALINYYSATRFLKNKKKFWPADLHLLGKEILWFHNVIWQAMLLSAEIPLPKKTFSHSFYIMKEKKMSKTLGNLITPEELIEKFGVDGTRYLIAGSLPLEKDANISLAKFGKKYNADLANDLGNLVSRTVKLCQKNKIKIKNSTKPIFIKTVAKKIETLNLPGALETVQKEISKINKVFNQKQIWQLKGKILEKELVQIMRKILQINHNLRPFIPETSEKIEAIFKGKAKLNKPLFPRIK